MITVALDVMTAEAGPDVTLKAAQKALKAQPNLRVWLVGTREVLERFAAEDLLDDHRSRVLLEYAPDVITHSDDPVAVLRQKKESSTHKTVRLVQKGYASACVSCANTGALMAIGRFVLKRLPGVDRLFLAARYPTDDYTRNILLADVGASMDLEPKHMVQLVKLLSAYLPVGEKKNKIGLLSCGVEKGKGNRLVNASYALLKHESCINFFGLMEPADLFLGDADAAICDGFVGNAVLKTTESTAKFMQRVIKRALGVSWFSYLVGFCLQRYLQPFLKILRPEQRDGAIVLGLNGVVVKSHGNSKVDNVVSALLFAYSLAEQKAIERLRAVKSYATYTDDVLEVV